MHISGEGDIILPMTVAATMPFLTVTPPHVSVLQTVLQPFSLHMDYPALIPLLSAGWSSEDSFHSMLKLFSRKFKGHKDFLGGPGIKTSPSNAGGLGSIPDWKTTTPHASQARKTKHKTEAKWKQTQ